MGKPFFRQGSWYFRDGLYHVDHILVSAPVKKLRKLTFQYLDKHCQREFDTFEGWLKPCNGRFVSLNNDCGKTVLVYLSPEADIDTLVHEGFHATAYVLGSVGLSLADPSEEAYAYYLGWFVDQAMTRIM